MSDPAIPIGPLLSLDQAMRLLAGARVVITTPQDARLVAEIRENCAAGMMLLPGEMLDEQPPPVGVDVVGHLAEDVPRADMLALTVASFVTDSLVALLRTQRETEWLLQAAPKSADDALRIGQSMKFLHHTCVELGRSLTTLACTAKTASDAMADFGEAYAAVEAQTVKLTATSPPETANGRPPIASFG